MQRVRSSKRALEGMLALRSTARRVVAVGYHSEQVLDHYHNPRNMGSFQKNHADVGTGLVGAPACGDVLKLQIKVDDSTGMIVDACFKTFGCASAIASSSLVTEWLKGKQTEEALSIKNNFSAGKLQSIFHSLRLSYTAACLHRTLSRQPSRTTKLNVIIYSHSTSLHH